MKRGTIGHLGIVIIVIAVVFAPSARASYNDLVSFFTALGGSADAGIFPVLGRDQDDLESAFGPRMQPSTDLYDWHRGVDIDGTLNTDVVVAPLKGYLYDYRFTSSGGNIVILEHRFADFLGGSVPSIEYAGKTLTKFYTWHLHLFDDGVAGNGVGTSDIMSSFTIGQSIAAGTTIGILGNTGAAVAGGDGYAPHLHFELRVGTNSSLEFQLANPDTTQWGFDPHMNPMFLFGQPAIGTPDYHPTLTTSGGFDAGQSATFHFATGNDEQPTLNRWEVKLVNLADGSVARSHAIDYNQRTGFDASSTGALDAFATNQGIPFVEPVAYGDTATDFQANLVVPAAWWAGYDPRAYQLEVSAKDIWGNVTTVAVPEPPTLVLFGLIVIAGLSKARSKII